MNCFFCVSLTAAGGLVRVDASEARHAATSRRQRKGEQVLLVDGKGSRAEATIVGLDRSGMELRIESIEQVPAPRPAVVLATAVAKGDRQSVLLDMATQMGVVEYIPLICEHSVVKPDAHNVPRWYRICTQACKQSHNSYLPEISAPRSPRELASSMRETGTPLYLAALDGEPLPSDVGVDKVAVCVGPEGGFSSSEIIELKEAGARPLSLGPNILRIETAAIAAVNAMQLRLR